MSKKKNEVRVRFVGMSSSDVTGSAHLVTYKKEQVLLDCGFYQCSDKLKQYQINNRNLKYIKPKQVKAIVISHLHLDHYGLTPRLFKEGCKGAVYVPKGCKGFLKTLFEDNLKIIEKDAEYLTKRENKKFKPLYEKCHVDKMMEHVKEIDFNNIKKITEFMSIRYSNAYHILHSAQIELFVNDGNLRKTIYYSGDIGNLGIKDKIFLDEFQPVKNADCAIVETTYATDMKKRGEKTRKKDIEKLQTVIRETCLEKKKGNVIIGSFAMQRSQEILYELYNLYGEDESFNVPIVLDSPLGIKVTKEFEKSLDGRDKFIMQKILEWKNLRLVDDWEDSKAAINSDESKIVIACSGFAEAGRIRDWLKHDIPNEDSVLVWIGYSSPESLSGIIKEGKRPEIFIDDVKVENKCKVINLYSYSSHIQHDSMLSLYSDMNVNQIYLVHSEMSRRVKFAKLLENEYRKKNKTTKVFLGLKDCEIIV